MELGGSVLETFLLFRVPEGRCDQYRTLDTPIKVGRSFSMRVLEARRLDMLRQISEALTFRSEGKRSNRLDPSRLQYFK